MMETFRALIIDLERRSRRDGRGQKAAPYSEALQRLNAAFSPKPGDLFTHAQLQAVIQADENRYRNVLVAWMGELRARGLRPSRMGRARGIGLDILVKGKLRRP